MISQLELLHFALWHARCEIVRHASAESCILTVRILSTIYHRMGIRSLPIVVGVAAMNEGRWAQFQRGEEPDAEDGSFGIRIPHRYEEPEKWVNDTGPWPGGHIILLAENRYLCDPSADQFSVPDAGLTAMPLVLDLKEHGPAFAEGDFYPMIQTEEKARIAYEPFPDDLSYLLSSDWQTLKDGDPLFDRVSDQVTGLVDLVQEAGKLPALPSLPVAFRASDLHNPTKRDDVLRQSYRSGVELGQIEPTAVGVADFIMRQSGLTP